MLFVTTKQNIYHETGWSRMQVEMLTREMKTPIKHNQTNIRFIVVF